METDLKKVITALENCTASIKCRDCPWEECESEHEKVELPMGLANEILAVMKSQEARVMRLEELDAIYHQKSTHVWPYNKPPYLYMTPYPNVRYTKGFWICWRDIMYSLENDSPFYIRENYGKDWVIWTAEPTDEEREAVNWE